jgi:hypothetical protein
MFVFLVSRKSGLIISYLSSDKVSTYKLSQPYVDWRNFCFHLRSLNVRHFETFVAVRDSKLWRRGHYQLHDIPTDFLILY